eukprot:scaffold664_cov260-Pinguiococcus_pyrenoidosus.AAC.9
MAACAGRHAQRRGSQRCDTRRMDRFKRDHADPDALNTYFLDCISFGFFGIGVFPWAFDEKDKVAFRASRASRPAGPHQQTNTRSSSPHSGME